jgi:serine/threonine-protein kinase BUR1
LICGELGEFHYTRAFVLGLLLTDQRCVFGEMFERKPILEGRTDIDQCVRIFKLVGSPNDNNMPGWSALPGCEGQKEWELKRGDIDQRFGQHLKPEGLDLLKSLLCLDYKKRINAFDALQHDYFKVHPLPARPEDLPRYQDSHELDSRRRGQEKKSNLPPAPAGGTVGMGPDEWNPNGPHYGGNGYHNGPMYGGRDRGPPGPPRRYDDRRGPPPPDASRQPQWRQDRRPPPPSNGHGLPPPPVNLPRRPDVVMPPNRDPPQPPPIAAGGARSGGPPNVDTYIPSYSGRSNDVGDRGRRGSRDSYRDPDAAPPPRSYRGDPPRASYRDMDGPPVQRDPYRERDPHGGHDRSRRTRSRSPEHHDDRRARLQNREKDFYAR